MKIPRCVIAAVYYRRNTMGLVKRVCVCASLSFVIFLFCVYFTLIHHPPADEILKSQLSGQSGSAADFELDPNVDHSMAEIANASWGKWLFQNKYVPIGDVFDSTCEDEERILVGKLVLLPDEDTNGVKVVIYTNTSFEAPIIYGTIHALVLYNGKEFYRNGLDLCTAEKDDEVKIMSCPISKGMHFIVKEKKVSPFIPKGEYRMKVWITNQDKKTVLCSDTVLKL